MERVAPAAERVGRRLTHWALLAGSILVASTISFSQCVASVAKPVTIAECRILNNHGEVAPFEAVSLTFSNVGSNVASEVGFRIVYAGETADVVDSGTFAPNVVIRHSFAAFRNRIYRGAVAEKCEVEYVRFEDGTLWRSRPP